MKLWEELEECSHNEVPWLVGGDFNVILNEEEKLAGLEVTQQEVVDFAQCVSYSGLLEINFSVSNYT